MNTPESSISESGSRSGLDADEEADQADSNDESQNTPLSDDIDLIVKWAKHRMLVRTMRGVYAQIYPIFFSNQGYRSHGNASSDTSS